MWKKLSIEKKITNPFFWLVIGPVLFLIYPIVSGKSLFWGTPALQFIPWRVYAFDLISQGRFPFFNELNGMSAPFFANYQSTFFYPFTWISYPFYLLADAPGVAWSYNLILLIHIILAGWGMARLIQQWKGNWVGMAVGGLAYSLGGYIVCRFGFFTMIWCSTWLPWMIYLGNQLFDEITKNISTKRTFLKFILVVSLQYFSGHAQLAWYSNLLMGGWFLTRVLIAKKKSSIKALALMACGVILSIGIASIQLIPTAEYLLQSQRSTAVEFVKAMSYSFWPWHFLNFIAPNLFGSPATGNYWGYLSYWEDAVYIGVLPLISAVLAPFMLFRRNDQREEFNGQKTLFIFGWSVIFVIGVLALGQNTNIFPFLYRYVPTFSLFSGPSRLMLIVVFMLAWFSGIGISNWSRPGFKLRKWIKRLIVVGLALILGAMISYFLLHGMIKSTVFLPVINLGCLTVAVFLLALNHPDHYQEPVWLDRWRVLVLGLVLLDLAVASIGFNPYINSNYFERNRSHLPSQDSPRIFISQKDEYLIKFSKFMRFTDFSAPGNWQTMRQAVLPNLNILEGINSANNFDPMLPGRYQNWLDAFDTLNNNQKKAWLRIMNVNTQYFATPRNTNSGVTPVNVTGYSFNSWSSCIQEVKDPSTALSLAKEIDFDANVLIERSGGQINRECKPGEKAEVKIINLGDSLEFSVNSPDEGVFWISKTYYPGWKVKVDGIENDLERVNYLFMGTKLDKGNHIIEFYYFPGSFILGAIVSFISLCVLVMLKWIKF